MYDKESFEGIGYHGTTLDAADIIINTQTFKESIKEEEWLGKGVYFFEKDIDQAKNFCNKARKYTQYSILESQIEAKVCIDLDKTKIMEQMNDIAKRIKSRYLKLKDGKTPRKIINSVILEFLYNLESYDMTKKTFIVNQKQPIERTNFEWVQIQMCVRNRDCIKRTREVERYE